MSEKQRGSLVCPIREPSAASGISAPVISRYRRGIQSPEPDGELCRKLAAGIAALAKERGREEIPPLSDGEQPKGFFQGVQGFIGQMQRNRNAARQAQPQQTRQRTQTSGPIPLCALL